MTDTQGMSNDNQFDDLWDEVELDQTPADGLFAKESPLSSIFGEGIFAETSFKDALINDVRVLDVGEPAREVARLLGLETQDNLPLPGEKPVVVVVSEPAEVDTLIEVDNRAWIGCIIAWHLPEISIERLFQLGVTVFVGLPLVKDVINAIEYLPDEAAQSQARSYAARLGTLEEMLNEA